MFILTYIENKLFLYVCQFPIFRNLDVYVFKLSESEVSECIMGNCCQVVKFWEQPIKFVTLNALMFQLND